MKDLNKKIDELVRSMTLEEKVAQMTQLADQTVRDGKERRVEALMDSGTVGSYLFAIERTRDKYDTAARTSRMRMQSISAE